MSTTKTQERVALVLKRLADIASADHHDAEVIAIDLDSMFDQLNTGDFFGTEGQSDPRGDFRDGVWSMDHVQGIDK